MNRLLHILLLLPLLSGFAVGDEEPQDDESAFNVVFFAPATPVFMRLHIYQQKLTIHQVRDQYAHDVFTGLDSDKDKQLNEKEASNIQALGGRFSDPERSGFLGKNWTKLDTDPKDDSISLSEFTGYVRTSMSKPFSVTVQTQQAQSVELFPKLDTDSDGVLTQQELAEAKQSLAKLDRDDDEAFSNVELQPFRDPNAQVPTVREAEGAAAAFQAISADNLDQIGLRLLSRYDRATEGRADKHLSAQKLGLSAEILGDADVDDDGRLNAKELKQFLKRPVAHVELKVELPPYRRYASRITVMSQLESKTDEPVSGKSIEVDLAGWKIPITSKLQQFSVRTQVSFFKQKFRQADGDKNKYLEAAEFPGLQLPGTGFTAVDLDSDDKVFVTELESYIRQRAILSKSRVLMTISQDGKSLFDVLDKSDDFRISPRELNESMQLLKLHDRNQDGKLAASELVGNFKIEIKLAATEFLTFDPAMNQMAQGIGPQPRVPTEGPVWFRKMDFNRDGDVSKREFLGNENAFEKLDTDGNQLIDLSEAEAAN